MPGDYGFDPLRLGTNQEALPYYREAERMNARWAMLAVAGILVTDIIGAGDFWTAGAKEGATGPFDLQTLIIIEAAFFAFVEGRRYQKVRSALFLAAHCPPRPHLSRLPLRVVLARSQAETLLSPWPLSG